MRHATASNEAFDTPKRQQKSNQKLPNVEISTNSIYRVVSFDVQNYKGFQTPWYQTPRHLNIACMPSKQASLVRPTPLSLRLIFARNIRLVRVHAGISQERMANEAGLDRAFVGTLERGQRNISIDNIELIANAIGIAAHELMDPDLPKNKGLDITATRAPRTTRLYPSARTSRKSK